MTKRTLTSNDVTYAPELLGWLYCQRYPLEPEPEPSEAEIHTRRYHGRKAGKSEATRALLHAPQREQLERRNPALEFVIDEGAAFRRALESLPRDTPIALELGNYYAEFTVSGEP